MAKENLLPEGDWEKFVQDLKMKEKVAKRVSDLDKMVEQYTKNLGPEAADEVRNTIDDVKRILTSQVKYSQPSRLLPRNNDEFIRLFELNGMPTGQLPIDGLNDIVGSHFKRNLLKVQEINGKSDAKVLHNARAAMVRTNIEKVFEDYKIKINKEFEKLTLKKNRKGDTLNDVEKARHKFLETAIESVNKTDPSSYALAIEDVMLRETKRRKNMVRLDLPPVESVTGGMLKRELFVTKDQRKVLMEAQKSKTGQVVFDAVLEKEILKSITDEAELKDLRLLRDGLSTALEDDTKMAELIWGKGSKEFNAFVKLDISKAATYRRMNKLNSIKDVFTYMYNNDIELKDFDFNMKAGEEFVINESLTKALLKAKKNITEEELKKLDREQALSLLRNAYGYDTDATNFIAAIQDYGEINLGKDSKYITNPRKLFVYTNFGEGKGSSFSYQISRGLKDEKTAAYKSIDDLNKLKDIFGEEKSRAVELRKMVIDELAEPIDTLNPEGELIAEINRYDAEGNLIETMEKSIPSFEQNLDRLPGGGYDYNDLGERTIKEAQEGGDKLNRFYQEIEGKGGWSESPTLRRVDKGTAQLREIRSNGETYELVEDGKSRVLNIQEIVERGKPRIEKGNLVVDMLGFRGEELYTGQLKDIVSYKPGEDINDYVGYAFKDKRQGYSVIDSVDEKTGTVKFAKIFDSSASPDSVPVKYKISIQGHADRLQAAKLLGETVNVDGEGHIHIENINSNTGEFTYKRKTIRPSEVSWDLKEFKLTEVDGFVDDDYSELVTDDLIKQIRDQLKHETAKTRQVVVNIQGSPAYVDSQKTLKSLLDNAGIIDSTKRGPLEKEISRRTDDYIYAILAKHSAWALQDPTNLEDVMQIASIAQSTALDSIRDIDFTVDSEGITRMDEFMKTFTDRFNKYFYEAYPDFRKETNPIIEKLIAEYEKLSPSTRKNVSLVPYIQNAVKISAGSDFEIKLSNEDIRAYLKERNTMINAQNAVSFEETFHVEELDPYRPGGYIDGTLTSEFINDPGDFIEEMKSQDADPIYKTKISSERGRITEVTDKISKEYLYRGKTDSVQSTTGTVLETIEKQKVKGISKSERGIISNKTKAIHNKFEKIEDSIRKGKGLESSIRDTLNSANLEIIDEKAMRLALRGKVDDLKGMELRDVSLRYKHLTGKKIPKLNVQEDVLNTILDVYGNIEKDTLAKMNIEEKTNEAVSILKGLIGYDKNFFITKDIAVHTAIGDKGIVEEVLNISKKKAAIKAVKNIDRGDVEDLGVWEKAFEKFGIFHEEEIQNILNKPGAYGLSKDTSFSNVTTIIKNLETLEEMKGVVDGKEYTWRLVNNVPVAFDEFGKEAFEIGKGKPGEASVFSNNPNAFRFNISQSTKVSGKIELMEDLDLDIASRKRHGYSNQNAGESIQNLREFFTTNGELKKNKRFVVADFETSGLVGQIDEELLNLVEISAKKYTAEDTSKPIQELSLLVKPPERLKEFMGGVTADNIDQLSEEEIGILRNYAKYSPDVYNFNTETIVNTERSLRYSDYKNAIERADYNQLLIDSKAGFEFVDQHGEDVITALESFSKTTRGSVVVGQNFADADVLFRLNAIYNKEKEVQRTLHEMGDNDILDISNRPFLEKEIASLNADLVGEKKLFRSFEETAEELDDTVGVREDIEFNIFNMRDKYKSLQEEMSSLQGDAKKRIPELHKESEKVRKNLNYIADQVGIRYEDIENLNTEQLDDYFKAMIIKKQETLDKAEEVASRILTLQQKSDKLGIELANTAVENITKGELLSDLNRLEVLKEQQFKVIDNMHLFSVIRPEQDSRSLQTQLSVLFGEDSVAHIGASDTSDEARVFGKILTETETGLHPELLNHVSHSDALRKGEYVAKVFGTDELGDAIHGVYKYRGITQVDDGVLIALEDMSIKDGDRLIALKAANLNEAKTLIQRDYVRIGAGEAQEHLDYFLWDETRRNVKKARSGYNALSFERENAAYTLGDTSVVSNIEDTISLHDSAVLKKNAGEELTSEEARLVTNEYSFDKNTRQMLQEKIERFEEVYPENKRKGLRKTQAEEITKWLDSTEAEILEPAYRKIKILEDSNVITGEERKSIIESINQTVDESGTRKIKEFSWIKSLGSVEDEAGKVTNLYLNTSSASSARGRIQSVFDTLLKSRPDATEGDLVNIIENIYPGLMQGADTRNLNTIAQHLYRNRDKLNAAQIEDFQLNLTGEQVDELGTKVNEYIDGRIAAKYSSALSEDEIKGIIKQVDDYTKEESNLPFHYIKEDLNIRFKEVPDNLTPSNVLKGPVNLDELFDFAEKYKRQDYKALWMKDNEFAKIRFDEWYRQQMGMNPTDQIPMSSADYKATINHYFDEIQKRIKPQMDILQQEGARDVSKIQSRQAWYEISNIIDRSDDDFITQKARERVGWINTEELVDTEDLITRYRKLNPEANTTEFGRVQEALTERFSRLGQSRIVGAHGGGLALNEISFDALMEMNKGDVVNDHMRRQADLYLEVANVLKAPNPSKSFPVDELPDFVGKEIDNILGELGTTRVKRTEAVSNAADVLQGAKKAATSQVDEVAEAVIKKGFSKKAMIGIAAAAALGGMLLGGIRYESPAERAAKAREIEEREKDVIRGQGDRDWAGQNARSASTVRVDSGGGANIKVSARSAKGARGESVVNSVREDLGQSNVHITTTDDTTAVTKSWMEDLFIKALK